MKKNNFVLYNLILLAVSFITLNNYSCLSAETNNKPEISNSVMQDCEEALTAVAFQLTFSEMMSINLSKEQALKALETMKESDMNSYLEIKKGAAEACKVFRDEIKEEVNKKSSSTTKTK